MTMPMTLLLLRASLIAALISRSLRSALVSIQTPTVTFSPNSAAIGGTSSAPSVEEYRRTARVKRGEFLQVGANFFEVGGSRSATMWPRSNGA